MKPGWNFKVGHLFGKRRKHMIRLMEWLVLLYDFRPLKKWKKMDMKLSLQKIHGHLK